jgi:hypothetical protein
MGQSNPRGPVKSTWARPTWASWTHMGQSSHMGQSGPNAKTQALSDPGPPPPAPPNPAAAARSKERKRTPLPAQAQTISSQQPEGPHTAAATCHLKARPRTPPPQNAAACDHLATSISRCVLIMLQQVAAPHAAAVAQLWSHTLRPPLSCKTPLLLLFSCTTIRCGTPPHSESPAAAQAVTLTSG